MQHDIENGIDESSLSLPSNQPMGLLGGVRQSWAITSDEPFFSTRAFRWKGFYLLLGFVAVSLMGNAMVPQMFNDTDWRIGWLQVAFLSGGFLVAQFTCLAMWCVFGLGPFVQRLSITLGLSCLSCFAYIFGLLPSDGHERSLAIYIFICGVGGFVVACLPLLIARFFGGYRFRLSTAQVVDLQHQHKSQISLMYIIGLTTGAAILLALFRALVPANNGGGPPSVLLVLILIAQNAVFTLFWLWACVVVFSGAIRLRLKILIMLSVCLLVTPIYLWFMKWYLPVIEVGWIETLNAYAYAIGFSIYTWLALAIAWFVGIELQPSRAKGGSR